MSNGVEKTGLEGRMRRAGVAGRFYPGEARELAATVDALLAAAATQAVEGEILAAIAPHAGYIYSGAVAAEVYAPLRGRSYRRVVVIAPSHYESFAFTSIYAGAAYETPLGAVAVDEAFARELAALDPTLQLSSCGHDSPAAREEHAIEAQLPWLQRVLPEASVVPIVMGAHSYEHSRALGVALARMEGMRETLILVSTDLSHFHPYEEAVRLDAKTLNALSEWDFFSMARNFGQRIWEACGGAPLVAAMIASERLGANRAELLRYANSGDACGDRERVVGYGAALLMRSRPDSSAEPEFDLAPADRAALLALAHESSAYAARHKKLYERAEPGSEALRQDRGAFVTLTVGGRLRGCIGFVSPSKALYLTVRDAAAMASQSDRRFTPVTEEELPSIRYEISVLSPLRHLLDPEEIVVGRHGLLVKNGSHEGLLLPQVPVEQGWDRRTFLEQCCRKAGLSAESWREEQTDLFVFTAVVFAEEEGAG